MILGTGVAGEFVYGNGKKKWDKYIGTFRNGMFEGNGTYYFSDGNRYEGGFAGGLKEGPGIMFYRFGSESWYHWGNAQLFVEGREKPGLVAG